MSVDKNKQPISISLGLVLNDGDNVVLTEPIPAELYKEEAGKGYANCIEVPGLAHPDNKIGGQCKMLDWVESGVKIVVIHSSDGTLKDVSTPARAGLTTELLPGLELQTWTKGICLLMNTPMGQISIKDLEAKGCCFDIPRTGT